MSDLAQVEAAVLRLPPREQEELRDWLENLLEERLEMTDAFKDEIAAGKAEIAAGRVRVRQP
jgi:predicted transcriptional regulator